MPTCVTQITKIVNVVGSWFEEQRGEIVSAQLARVAVLPTEGFFNTV